MVILAAACITHVNTQEGGSVEGNCKNAPGQGHKNWPYVDRILEIKGIVQQFHDVWYKTEKHFLPFASHFNTFFLSSLGQCILMTARINK